MNQKILKEQRRKQYLLNQKKYNTAVLATYGGMLALIDYIEQSNEVFPELVNTSLVKECNKLLNALYKDNPDASISDDHNKLADKFRNVIKDLENESNG